MAKKTNPANPEPADSATKAPKTRAAKAATTKPEAPAKTKKVGCLDAAAKVLSETKQAMNCQNLIDAMATKGYWSSPNGQTPSATLYAAILREINSKGKDARFKKSERGKFEVRS